MDRAQGAAQSIEDAAFLGQLCCSAGTIQDVFRALHIFQMKRKERTTTVGKRSLEIGRTWALCDGPEQETRDKVLREGKCGVVGDGLYPNPFSDSGFVEWLYGNDVFEDAIRALD